MRQQDQASKLGHSRPSANGINLGCLLPRRPAKVHHASGAGRDEGGGSVVWQPSPWPTSSTWMVLCVMPRWRHAVVTSSITTLHEGYCPSVCIVGSTRSQLALTLKAAVVTTQPGVAQYAQPIADSCNATHA